MSAGRTNTFLGERYRRIARRRGRRRPSSPSAVLVIIWHLLADPEARYTDLGPDFHDRSADPERKKRAHIHQPEALGYTVSITPAA